MRPTWIEVNLGIISNNVQQIRRRVGANVKLMAVVKANAYGYGLLPISLYLANQVDYFGVALVEEAIALRQAGIQTPILSFNCYIDQYIEAAQHDVEVAVSVVKAVAAIETACRFIDTGLKVHVEVDTGMGITGIEPEQVLYCVELLQQIPQCKVVGLYSQLALSEYAEPDDKQLSKQADCFKTLADCLSSIPLKHLLASPGVALCPELHYGMVRCGCILFNGASQGGSWDLRDSMTLKSQVTMLRQHLRGASLGYKPRTHQAMRVAIVPIGYGDGYNREVSSSGEILIRGKRYPIVGDICMDKLAVEIEDDPIAVGDEVVLLGCQGQEAITLRQIAESTCQNEAIATIGFTDRIPRIYSCSV
ncbi:MAG: alanine racemase [Aphanocapsa sp. GSE-SYN-MK-11-07L]|jgi:alanine racemase|nr:alanine racemase [Aphanocapsa sp. GSE-SYN-MK-11-07L]